MGPTQNQTAACSRDHIPVDFVITSNSGRREPNIYEKHWEAAARHSNICQRPMRQWVGVVQKPCKGVSNPRSNPGRYDGEDTLVTSGIVAWSDWFPQDLRQIRVRI